MRKNIIVSISEDGPILSKRGGDVYLQVLPGERWRQQNRNLLQDQEWQKKRRLVLEKFNNTCVFCGFISTRLNIHHVCGDIESADDPNRDDIKFLIPLRQWCHRTQHIGFTGMKKYAELVDVESDFFQKKINFLASSDLNLLYDIYPSLNIKKHFGPEGLVDLANHLLQNPSFQIPQTFRMIPMLPE